MAPLRNNRASNRATNRGQTEVDIMEGLPVRQWRKHMSMVHTAPPQESSTMSAHDARWTELPMPRGSDMYSPWSQALLRAARKGPINPSLNRADDDKEGQDETEQHSDLDAALYMTKWAPIPRDLEQPEPEFLAKRRKGLPSLYGAVAETTTAPAPMRKVRVKKIDADGNASIFECLAPEGVTLEGEIIEGEEAVMTEAPAPGTVVEGVGVVNAEGLVVATESVVPTPNRRRPPPPPKRKNKGPGRGRKKKRVEQADGTPASVAPDGSSAPANGVTPSAGNDAANGVADGHVASGAPPEEINGQEGEGSDEDDDDGEEGDDGDREDGELSDGEAAISTAATPSKVHSGPTGQIAPSSPDIRLASDKAINSPTKSNSLLPPSSAPATSEPNTSAVMLDVAEPYGVSTNDEPSSTPQTSVPIFQNSAAPSGHDGSARNEPLKDALDVSRIQQSASDLTTATAIDIPPSTSIDGSTSLAAEDLAASSSLDIPDVDKARSEEKSLSTSAEQQPALVKAEADDAIKDAPLAGPSDSVEPITVASPSKEPPEHKELIAEINPAHNPLEGLTTPTLPSMPDQGPPTASTALPSKPAVAEAGGGIETKSDSRIGSIAEGVTTSPPAPAPADIVPTNEASIAQPAASEANKATQHDNELSAGQGGKESLPDEQKAPVETSESSAKTTPKKQESAGEDGAVKNGEDDLFGSLERHLNEAKKEEES